MEGTPDSKIELRLSQIISSIKSGMKGLYLALTLYILLFAAAEYIIYNIRGFIGIILYFMILLSLIVNSTLNHEAYRRRFWLTLGLVPLTRIISLAIPVAEISQIIWYILIAIPVLAGTFIVMRTLKMNLADVGLNGNKLLIQVLIALAGILGGIIDYFILQPQALNTQINLRETLFPAAILLISTGFTEELAFRGVMQKAAGELLSWGWIFIALVYAVLQIGQDSILQIVFAFAVGLFWGWSVKKTGSIVGVILSHGILNISLYLILPHLFSG